MIKIKVTWFFIKKEKKGNRPGCAKWYFWGKQNLSVNCSVLAETSFYFFLFCFLLYLVIALSRIQSPDFLNGTVLIMNHGTRKIDGTKYALRLWLVSSMNSCSCYSSLDFINCLSIRVATDPVHISWPRLASVHCYLRMLHLLGDSIEGT